MPVLRRLRHAMQLLSGWARKPIREQLGIGLAAGLLVAVHGALRIWSYPRVLAGIERAARRFPSRAKNDTRTARERAEQVERVAHRIFPNSPCLSQALAVCFQYWRRNLPASIHLGAMKDCAGVLSAHAWVESAGEVIVGETEKLADYELLSGIEVPE